MAAGSASAPSATLPLPETLSTFVAPGAWRAIDFISDLHLASGTPKTFDAWASHLRHTSADAVFILGDLFEAWIGDDMAERGFEAECVAVLSEVARTRCVAFMAGNRDFLVGDAFLEAHGLMRLQDPTLVEAFGGRALLSHGDALCLDDTAYQRFRSVVRRPGVQSAFLSLPLSWRTALGRAARRRSASSHATGPQQAPRVYADLDVESMRAWLRSAESPVLVHGHTHAPASHELAPGLERHVLTDWDLDDTRRPPRAEVLRWSRNGFERIAPSTSSTVTA